MTAPLNKDELLRELGFAHPTARARALEVLEDAKLTNPRKTAIAADKRDRVEAVLNERLARRCTRCRHDPTNGRESVSVLAPTDCELCGGSPNAKALAAMAKDLRRAGVRRVVVVGGSPGTREALTREWPADVELRVVDGTARHTGKKATANLDWADVVAIWGGTELDHKVSRHYTIAGGGTPVVTVSRRGIEALALALATHASKNRRR